MPQFVLTDLANDVWVDHASITPAQLGLDVPIKFDVKKRVLRGGRRDGVDLIEVHTDTIGFTTIPTRGMGIGLANYRGGRIGWFSPTADGPVNPMFIQNAGRGGIGWLEGFDELLVRCGLENNGAAFETKTKKPDGSESNVIAPLHGRIANTPAHYVSVTIDDAPPHAITVEGRVLESSIFLTQLELRTKITVVPGENSIKVRDEIVNVGDSPQEFQLLHHWNFGPPHLDEGAHFFAPVKEVVPRDPRAREGIGHYDIYGKPEPGFAEQVYFLSLHGEGPEGKTLAMLRNRPGDNAVVLRFSTAQMPAFTLWKCTRGLKEGYVTGLEPATNYPNPKPFEKQRGRVVPVPVGGSYVAEVALEVLDSSDAIGAVEAEVRALQSKGSPIIRQDPGEPFAPAV